MRVHITFLLSLKCLSVCVWGGGGGACVCVCACVFVCWAKKIRLVASTFAHWLKHVLSKHICWRLFYPNTRVLPSTWMCLMGVSTVLPSLQHFTGVKIKSSIVLVPCKLQCSGTHLFKDPTWLSRPPFSDLAPLSLFSDSAPLSKPLFSDSPSRFFLFFYLKGGGLQREKKKVILMTLVTLS